MQESHAASSRDRERLLEIEAKVDRQERLSFEDGVFLYRTPELTTVGRLANKVRERLHGGRTYYNVNRHLNPTNICYVECGLCAWARKPGEDGEYLMSIQQAVDHAAETWSESVTEFHIVGGLHPTLPFEYYVDLLRALRERFPGVHLKAFTMVEIEWLARRAKRTIRETIEILKEAGLGSCPGGGAEILAKRVRDIICTNKMTGEEWLDVSRMVHQAGIRSNATMLYGHVETDEERVDHLVRLRELQDETRGFQVLIPLAFHPENTALSHLPPTTGFQDLKNIAVSRLMLDNFDHIKAYWIQIGPRIAQIALRFGADDLDGTIIEETITHAAGARTDAGMTHDEIERLIRAAGREPVERDTLYRPVVRDGQGAVATAP
ncbi:MAG: aminofutalosine synthase MqnE [Acidobacteriota bacterium]|jgi:aminodeoxyfutalosine synthase